MIQRTYLAPGIRVSYTYMHSLNAVSKVQRTKLGTVLRTVKHRNPFYAQKIAVQFDENIGETILDINDVKVISQ